MATNFKNLIEKEVDRLFAELNAKPGECCRNPVTGIGFVWGDDPIAPQKEEAVRALRAAEWFAVNGPPDAPPLPLSHDEIEDYRKARGLAGVVGFYARSLSRQGYGRQSYDVRKHPSFEDFARGLMAIAVDRGLWDLEKDAQLKRRFAPCLLAGMTPGAYWSPPKEYEATMAVTDAPALLHKSPLAGQQARPDLIDAVGESTDVTARETTRRAFGRRGARRSVAGTFAACPRQARV